MPLAPMAVAVAVVIVPVVASMLVTMVPTVVGACRTGGDTAQHHDAGQSHKYFFNHYSD